MGSKKFHPKTEFARNILSKLDKIYLSKPQAGNFLSFNMKHILQPPPALYNVVYLQQILPQHCTTGEGMREGEIQFYSKIESVQNIIQNSSIMHGQTITINIVFQQITFFLTVNNHSNLTG